MQLKDLVKPISDQTDEELQERLRQIRNRRDVVRPARAKIIEKAEAKITRKKVSSVEKLLDMLSPEELESLFKKAEGDTSE